eukprot:3015045-Rhodomonas_salina.2
MGTGWHSMMPYAAGMQQRHEQDADRVLCSSSRTPEVEELDQHDRRSCRVSVHPAIELDAELRHRFKRAGLEKYAEMIAERLGAEIVEDLAQHVTEADVENAGLPAVQKNRLKRLIEKLKEEAATSQASTSEDDTDNDTDMPVNIPGEKKVVMGYNTGEVEEFERLTKDFLDKFRQQIYAESWVGDGEALHRLSLCAIILLNLLCDMSIATPRFCQEGEAWFNRFQSKGTGFDDELLVSFVALFDHANSTTWTNNLPTCAKDGSLCVGLIDKEVREILGGDGSAIQAWESRVVKDWFRTAEPVRPFLHRSDCFFSEARWDERKIQALGAIKTRSFQAFLVMDKFSEMLFFAYLQECKFEESCRITSYLEGFTTFISSSGKTWIAVQSRGGGLPPLRVRKPSKITFACLCFVAILDLEPFLTAAADLPALQVKQIDQPEKDAWSRVCSRAGEDAARMRTAYIEATLSETAKMTDAASGAELDVEASCLKLRVRAAAEKSPWSAVNTDEGAKQLDLLCPLLLSVMHDPVRLLGDGKLSKQCFERIGIKRWMSIAPKHPLTNEIFGTWDLIEDPQRRAEIAVYVAGMQKQLLVDEQAVESETERRLLLQRKGYKSSSAADREAESPSMSDETILQECCKRRSFCVIAPPAAGKTTTMLRLVNCAAKVALQDENALVPLFVRAAELARLLSTAGIDPDCNPLQLYIEHTPRLDGAKDVLKCLYDEGLLLVIIDGLDEAEMCRESMEAFLDCEVSATLRSERPSRIVVSTRASSYAKSRAYNRLSKFEVLEIQPMNEALARSLIKQRIGNEAQENSLWEALQILKLQSPELVENPFQLSLVISAFCQNGSIPSQRGELYKLSIDGMLRRVFQSESASLERGLHFLQCLAYISHLHLRHRDFAFDESTMALVLEQWSRRGYDADLAFRLKAELFDQVLVGVCSCVSIATPFGSDTFRFSHLTQQEYLAASHVVATTGQANHVLEALQSSHFSCIDPWIREVVLHIALLLEESEFDHFCDLILAQEEGTFAHCELVKDLLAERGSSDAGAIEKPQKVADMLECKFKELRSLDDVAIALCHPSPDMREREITELRRFACGGSSGSGHIFSTEKVIQVLKKVVDNREQSFSSTAKDAQDARVSMRAGRFARCAAVLSAAQLCDSRASVQTVQDMAVCVLKWMQEPALYSVAVKALGTLTATASSDEKGHIVHSVIAKELRDEVKGGHHSLTASALADLKLALPVLVHSFAEEVCLYFVPRATFRYGERPIFSSHVGILRYIAEISRAEGVDAESRDGLRAHHQLLIVAVLALSSNLSCDEQTHTFGAVERLLNRCQLTSLFSVAARSSRFQCADALDQELVHKFTRAVLAYVLERYFREEGGDESSSEKQVGEVLRQVFGQLTSDECVEARRELEAHVSRDSKPGSEPGSKPRPAETSELDHEEGTTESRTIDISKPKRRGDEGCRWLSRDTLGAWDKVVEDESGGQVSQDITDVLWKLCFEGASIDELQHSSEDVYSFLNLKFGDPDPLEQNSQAWADCLVDCLRLPCIGRFLFSSLLRHIATVVTADPQLSGSKLQPLTAALQRVGVQNDSLADSVLAQYIRLERRKLLKELQVGPRCDAPSLWKGLVSLRPSKSWRLRKNKGILERWEQIKRDSCHLRGGNGIVARVFPTDKEGTYWVPDLEDSSTRVYKVERGVEMCLGVKNFTDKAITVEPFYVDTEGKEQSEGHQIVSPFGQSQLKLKSELGDGEIQDAWRLKDVSGE